MSSINLAGFPPRRLNRPVEKLAQTIQPLFRAPGDEVIYFIEPSPDVDDPDVLTKPRRIGPVYGLQLIAICLTAHRYDDSAEFRPTQREVLEQIPEHFLAAVDYYLVDGPRSSSDLSAQSAHLADGLQAAVTSLFRKREVQLPGGRQSNGQGSGV